MKKILAIAIVMFAFFQANSQTIGSVAPNVFVSGDNSNISIRGIGTNFKQGDSKVEFSPAFGITVNNIKVLDNLSITANIIVDAGVSGPFTLSVSTGKENVTFPISVEKAGGKEFAIINALPVQKISVSDFDPNNIKAAPLLFSVKVYLLKVPRDLTARLTVKGVKYGKIGSATKDFINQQNKQFFFNNRDFDKVDINTANKEFALKALNTGYLPADDYTYYIEILEKGKVIMTTDANFTINDQSAPIVLIGPGGPLTSTPDITYSRNPQFQWYSQTNNYDLNIYAVDKGQRSANDITSKRPIYSITGLTRNSFAYPTSARPLEEGKTYAWVITGHLLTSRGDQAISSEVFWFNIAKPNPDFQQISRVEIFPTDVQLQTGDTITFMSKAYDEKGQLLRGVISPEWKITPVSNDRIDRFGKFTAGEKPGTVAVIVRYGDKTEYSTITVRPGNLGFDLGNFFVKVFGLPATPKQ
ncbi:MAG: hypothetical protein NTX03_05125 [Bacteroidetes bacterium]|nr:hypothetical protein [Bacteroidota bacterium]